VLARFDAVFESVELLRDSVVELVGSFDCDA
jgi:hypothetical protein